MVKLNLSKKEVDVTLKALEFYFFNYSDASTMEKNLVRTAERKVKRAIE